MSIPNIVNKIKGRVGIDNISLLYFFIVLGVGVGSFSLGRLSVVSISTNQAFSITSQGASVGSLSRVSGEEMPYVASKNGKLYYTVSCPPASRILPENKVWFTTTREAEGIGYRPSPSCDF